MNSRFLSLVAVFCSFWLVSPTSFAEPFVFTFDMPAFNEFGNIGVTSVLEVTVDNGGSSNWSQAWNSDQIIALSTDITGPSSSMRIQNGVEVGAITTDATGVPTMAFADNYYAFGLDAEGVDLLFVGLDCDYAVFSGGSPVGAVGCAVLGGDSIWPLTGYSGPPAIAPPPAPVPTLSQWALIMLSMFLVMIVFSNRKRLF